MNFFIKYKIHFNLVFILFWAYVIYDVLSSEGFIIKKLIVPILFIILGVFNIFEALKNNKPKSED
jgi:hypothetical protein